jgi:hypothetical protein
VCPFCGREKSTDSSAVRFAGQCLFWRLLLRLAAAAVVVVAVVVVVVVIVVVVLVVVVLLFLKLVFKIASLRT